ncbi:MAG: hypothetical protein WCO60_02515 [Verrucomicrobiota bacterium]
MRFTLWHPSLLLALSAPLMPVHAACLVLKVSTLSKTVTGDSITASSPVSFPPYQSTLLIVDLDRPFVVEKASGQQFTLTEKITLSEPPGKNGGKSFSHGPIKDANSLEYWNTLKFQISGKTPWFSFFSDSFEYFPSDGIKGVDVSSLYAQAACTPSVDIGGGWKSPTPKTFTCTQKRTEHGKLKTSVLAISYDAAITKAVNDYLATLPYKAMPLPYDSPLLGSGAISVAKEWLVKTYLPANYPSKFPVQ